MKCFINLNSFMYYFVELPIFLLFLYILKTIVLSQCRIYVEIDLIYYYKIGRLCLNLKDLFIYELLNFFYVHVLLMFLKYLIFLDVHE